VRCVQDEGSTRVPPSVTEYDAEANPVVASEALMSDTPARL
jgi:hypothetical protein